MRARAPGRAHVDLGFLVHQREQIGEAAHRLRLSEHEEASGAKREVQERHHPALQERTQVYEDVPQTYEVELGERRIPGEIVLGEDARLPNALDYLVPRVDAR